MTNPQPGNRRKPDKAWHPLYPFDPHYLKLSPQKHISQHYLDEGPRTEGRAVVMLHGNPTWSFYYRNLVLALRGEFRCVVPDHVGCGLSDKPQHYPYTLAQHIDNLERLLDELKLESVDLVLHDWGGAIGMGAAIRKPSRVRKIVVLNTAAFLSKRIPFRINICKLPVFGALAIRGFNAFAGAAIHMAVEKKIAPAVREGLLAPYNSWKNRIATLRFVQDIPMKPSHLSWSTLKAIDDGIAQFKDRPMRICWGMKDWCFNESFLKTWIERFPAARVERYEDAGHYVLEDAHERIAPKVLEFLRR
ncbi:MAG TPA: alpha/beta fold hydrolase [Planctomycetota bacterium]|nr:alpha/beta fold hydrolase [Planctomycetota bacterium]